MTASIEEAVGTTAPSDRGPRRSRSLLAPMRRSQALTYGALLVAIAGWASLHPIAKGVVGSVGVLQTAFARGLIACVTLLVITALLRGPAVLWRELRNHPEHLAIYAVLSFTISSLLAMAALRVLPAGINAVFNNMGPLYLAVATALAGKARRPWLLGTGAVIAFVGITCVVLPGTEDHTHLNVGGMLLSGSSSFVIAAQAVYGRWLLAGRDALAVTGLSAGMAAILLGSAVPFFGGLQPVLRATPDQQWALLYLGVGATALNFACWSFALQHLPATRAMLFQNFIPPAGVLLAVLLVGEQLSFWLTLGVVLIVGGTHLAQRGLRLAVPKPRTGGWPADGVSS